MKLIRFLPTVTGTALAFISIVGTAPQATTAGSDPATTPQPSASTEMNDSTTEASKQMLQPRLHTEGGKAIYLVQLADDPLPIASAKMDATLGNRPRRLDEVPEDRIDMLIDQLETAQADVVQQIGNTLGHDPNVVYQYQRAVNGLAVELTADEAATVASEVPGIISIAHDEERELQTDAGPQLIDADEVWTGADNSMLGGDFQGEGTVIGIIDTGVAATNDSFSDDPADGFVYTNPYDADPLDDGPYLGDCAPGRAYEAMCNNKLVGIYKFGNAASPIDRNGHGSHTASTAGGNALSGITFPGVSHIFNISGVAPHANIITYNGCCTVSGLTRSIEQAITDGVDVINYSIGSSSPSVEPWSDFDTLGFLNARAAGIFVATSNGNGGPDYSTTGSPADAPWLTAVGASTHARYNQAALIDVKTSTATMPPIDGGVAGTVTGKGTTEALDGPAEIVYAGEFGDPKCEKTSSSPPSAGIEAYKNKIVVCDRGGPGRVQKSENVASLGAVGYVLVNDSNNGESLLADRYALPGVFVSYADGTALKNFLANQTAKVTGSISATEVQEDGQNADNLASFSSRGPNRAMDIISPHVTAPGIDILAAYTDNADDGGGNKFNFLSGTSMASPHVAGAGALLMEARPDWSVAEMQSALMSTATPTVRNHNLTEADPYQQGNGRINVAQAIKSGLLFNVTHDEYVGANPAVGGDVKTLNIPSMADTQCLVECSWQRAVRSPLTTDVTWTATTESEQGMILTVSLNDGPAEAIVPGEESMQIDVTANVSAAEVGQVVFGRVTLTPDAPNIPPVTMPVAVVPTNSVLPGRQQIDTRRDAGSQQIEDLRSREFSDFQSRLDGWVKPTITQRKLVQDPTNASAYDDLRQVHIEYVKVPANSSRLVAEVLDTEIPDIDLYVGRGNTVSSTTQLCQSASGGSNEYCNIDNPEPGTYWVLIQNWQGTTQTAPNSYDLATAVVGVDGSTNGTISGPQTAATNEDFDITVTWDIPDSEADDIYYGAAVMGTDSDHPENVGIIPIDLHRHADDVVKTANKTIVDSGDMVGYNITVRPNVGPTDATYAITDTVPAGLTIDPSSISNGGQVNGQTITWNVTMPSLRGSPGDYVITDENNPDCATPSGDGGFIDLASRGFEPQAGFNDDDGDSIAQSFFPTYVFKHFGTDYHGLTVTEDGYLTAGRGFNAATTALDIPQPAAPNNVLAPLWSDLQVGDASKLYATEQNGFVVVQYSDFQLKNDAGDGPSVGDFQIWWFEGLVDGPEIIVAYGERGTMPDRATIGTENADGTTADAVLSGGDPAPIFREGAMRCFDYVAPSGDQVVLTYNATVDADATANTYTNVVEHTTNDPAAKVAKATAAVRVLHAGHLTLDRSILDLGDVEVGHSTSTVVKATNDGTEALIVENVSTSSPFSANANCDTLDPGESCNIKVTFTPRSTGSTSKKLSIRSNASEIPLQVNLAGNGVPLGNNPVPNPAPQPIDAPALIPVHPARFVDTRNEPTFDQQYSNSGLLQAGTSLTVKVTGRGEVPNDAVAVVANLTAIEPKDPGFATMYPCNMDAPVASHVNYFTGQVTPNNAVVPLNADGELCIYTSAASDFALDINGYAPQVSPLSGITPERFLDTRVGESTIDDDYVSTGPVTAGSSIEVKIAGRADVPEGATTALLNLTALNATEPGYLTLYPCTSEVPQASTVNYLPGQIRPNGVVADLSEDGTVCVYSLVDADVLIDVAGYLPIAVDDLVADNPSRSLDTREHTGDALGRATPGDITRVKVAGVGTVPSNATAAILNLAAVKPDRPGFATLYPCSAEGVPRVSNVNFTEAGTIIANNAITKLSPDGEVCIFTSTGTDLVLDVAGWLT